MSPMKPKKKQLSARERARLATAAGLELNLGMAFCDRESKKLAFKRARYFRYYEDTMRRIYRGALVKE